MESELRAFLHVRWGGLGCCRGFDRGAGYESVPVAVVGEVEEGVADGGGWGVDDAVSEDGEFRFRDGGRRAWC